MNEPSASVLLADHLSKSYPTPSGELHVLRGVSLALEAGESAAIMGPSGSGKSTLLSILGTLELPSSGRLTIGGQEPFGLNPSALADFRNRQVGFVFQDHHLLGQCTALENVLVPTLAGKTRADAQARARELLGGVGLGQRMDHRPAELSGGERQRVAIARALINAPAVLLADEPTGNLDRRSAEAVADLLVELHRADRTVLIVATHSPALAERFTHRYELIDGALCAM